MVAAEVANVIRNIFGFKNLRNCLAWMNEKDSMAEDITAGWQGVCSGWCLCAICADSRFAEAC